MERKKRLCGYCGDPFPEEEMIEVDGILYCQDCVDEYATNCEECGAVHIGAHQFERVRIRRGVYRYVCSDCRNDQRRYYHCECCDDIVDGEYDEGYDVPGSHVCTRCYEEEYVTCEECGTVIPRSSATYNEYDEVYYCEACGQQKMQIKSYGYKPIPKCKTMQHDFFATPDDVKELLFGVENETDRGSNPYDTAAEITEQSEDVYVKHDGSLGCEGMEIVTHPCSCEYHTKKLGWEKICEVAKDNGYVSHDARTCGLHVHVGIKQLGEDNETREDTIAKIVALVDRHWDFLLKFSRRRKSQLERWAAPPGLNLTSGKHSEEEVIARALNTENRGRYQAVNLCNRNTIEFRLFNGSLVPSTIYATIQLVSNICEYCMTYNMQTVLNSKWKEIVNIKYYPELQSYIKGRGLEEMENPEPVALRGEYTEPEKPEFKENSIVKVIGFNGEIDQRCLRYGIGEIGRVVRRNSDGRWLISFANNFVYTLRSSFEDGLANLYNVEEQNLELVMA